MRIPPSTGREIKLRSIFFRAVNSAGECHPHTVEVEGSNPSPPTIEKSRIVNVLKWYTFTTPFIRGFLWDMPGTHIKIKVFEILIKFILLCPSLYCYHFATIFPENRFFQLARDLLIRGFHQVCVNIPCDSWDWISQLRLNIFQNKKKGVENDDNYSGINSERIEYPIWGL